MTLTELEAALAADGFTPGRPDEIIAQADEQFVQQASCPNCQHQGMEYHGYLDRTRYPHDGYRSVAVCPSCDEAVEF